METASNPSLLKNVVITLFKADSTLAVEPTMIKEPEKRSTKPSLMLAA